ncbi:MAG: DNA repair exonuclease [Lawsonibacter sp.]|nr:DNA repair exonuclease [Lawsonibacter sp.]
MLKIIHGADFHLDSPFAGLSPERAAQRRGEQRDLLMRLAALAQMRQADLVLLSGDLLDSERVYRETAKALSRALEEAGCPVVIAPGNHDFYSPRSVYATLDWPENVHIFTEERMQAVELPGCVVHGAAFLSPRSERSPLAGFCAPRDGRIHIGVLHGELEGGGSYAPLTREDIARSGLSYLALGHVHQYGGLGREGDTFWAYPGCPEGRGFDEPGEKGVLYLELGEKTCTAEFAPLCARRYEIAEADLTGREDPVQAVLGALAGVTEEDICRVVLTGETEPPDLAALERALAPRFYGLSLRDRTRPPRRLWERMEEDTLTGLFLREMDRLRRERPEDESLMLAVRFGLAALEGGEDAAP